MSGPVRNDPSAGLRPLLLKPAQVQHLLGLSKARFYEMKRDGLIPKAVQIGDTEPRWRYEEIRDWVYAGLPSVDSWRWRPLVPLKLDAFIERKRLELEDIQREIERAKIALAEGQTHTSAFVGESR